MKIPFNFSQIEILSQSKDEVILTTVNLLPTLIWFQNKGYKLTDLIPDDYYENGRMVERNILAFTRNEETFKKALNIN
jgi:hypothetical protein